MKFRFRLQKMMRLVETQERVKRLEVGGLLKKIDSLKKRKQTLDDDIRQLLQKQRVESESTVAKYHFYSHTIELEDRERKEIDLVIGMQERLLSERRAELFRLTRKRRALESLRDKRKNDFNKEQSKLEQKELDESFRLRRRTA